MRFESIFPMLVKNTKPEATDNDSYRPPSSLTHMIASEDADSPDASTPNGQPGSRIEDREIVTEIDTSEWPAAIDYDPEHPTTDPFLGEIKRTDEHLDIRVGKGKFVQRYSVHKDLICRYSGYFQRVCQANGTGVFQEANQGIFDLHDDNPVAFELFVDWLYSNKDEAAKDVTHELKKWNFYPVEAYALGDKLMADEFRPFALRHAINSARYFDQRDIEIIFDCTGPHDPLYRFTCRWLRWRCRQDPFLWEKSRSVTLQKERLRQEPTISAVGRDPRGFGLQHWFMLCCEISRSCQHQEAASHEPFYDRRNDRRLAKARLRRAWSRRKVYGYKHQLASVLAAYGSYASALPLFW